MIHDAFFRTTTRASDAPIVTAYDFSRFGVVADIGGSTGALLAAVLHEYPSVRGILFDLPYVVSGAGTILAEAGWPTAAR